MPSIDIASSSAEAMDSRVNLMRDSADGCACMDLDYMVGEFVNLIGYIHEVDLWVMRELYTGKVTADVVMTPSLARLYGHVTHMLPFLLGEVERFERKGYSVKRVDELRAVNTDNFGLFAILRTERGEDVPPPANLRRVLADINAAA